MDHSAAARAALRQDQAHGRVTISGEGITATATHCTDSRTPPGRDSSGPRDRDDVRAVDDVDGARAGAGVITDPAHCLLGYTGAHRDHEIASRGEVTIKPHCHDQASPPRSCASSTPGSDPGSSAKRTITRVTLAGEAARSTNTRTATKGDQVDHPVARTAPERDSPGTRDRDKGQSASNRRRRRRSRRQREQQDRSRTPLA